MTGKEVAQVISNYVNCNPTGKHSDVTSQVLKNHPTLQQATIRLCFSIIEAMATQEYVDDRNEDCVDACKTIVERCKDEMHLRFI